MRRFFLFCIFILTLCSLTPTAHAGLLLKPPLYIGLNSGLVGNWTFNFADMDYGSTGSQNTGALPPSAAGATFNQWTQPTNVFLSDDTRATESTNNQREDWYNFGFSIPSGAVIDGITVVFEANSSSGATGTGADIDLSWDGGTSFTSTQGFTTTISTDQNFTMGGSSDTWGRTWSATDFSNSNFRLRATKTGTESQSTRVDYISITVYYHIVAAQVVALDRSGQAHNGTLTNGAATTIGKIGQGVRFASANSQYVSVGDAGSEIKTVAFWMKANDATSQKLINIDGTDQIETNGSDQVVGTSFPGTTVVYVDGSSASTVVKDGQWHQVTITDTTGVTPSTLEFGRVSSTYFSGSLDEVRIYNRALSAQEVKRLYNMGGTLHVGASQNQKITNGLVGLWSFDQADLAGTVAYDRSGNANNGTLTNSPTRTIGKIGQGLDFDGLYDRVTLADLPSLNPTSELTLAG